MTNIATGNRKNSEFVQLQPVVRSFAVGFSPISVFFPVQRTGPANTNYGYKDKEDSGVGEEMDGEMEEVDKFPDDKSDGFADL